MDTLTTERRSELMRGIRRQNTSPELVVRKLCRELGFSGYRLHQKSLPGCPDIAWGRKKVAIFVNGCFWHGHRCRKNRAVPESNSQFWASKFKRNRLRDAKSIKSLRAMGWNVCIIWECELSDLGAVGRKIIQSLGPNKYSLPIHTLKGRNLNGAECSINLSDLRKSAR
jgi:DNA mismatch endonuclease, patch repair protein